MNQSVTDIVGTLVDEIRKSDFSLSQIAKRSGVGFTTIRKWVYQGAIPNVENAQAVFVALGKELCVEDLNRNAE